MLTFTLYFSSLKCMVHSYILKKLWHTFVVCFVITRSLNSQFMQGTVYRTVTLKGFIYNRILQHERNIVIRIKGGWEQHFTSMYEAEWLTRVFTLCPFWHTVLEQKKKFVEHGYKLNYQWKTERFSRKDFYPATTFVLWWFSNLTHPVQLLRFENIMYSTLGKGHATQRSLKLITIDSAAVPTLTRLQSGPCIHLKLLMHSSAANGKYHCKSLTLPRATGAEESRYSNS